MSDHHATVEHVALTHDVAYRAVCACGWKSSPRKKRGDAQTLAVEHAVGHEVKLKPSPGRGGWPSGF